MKRRGNCRAKGSRAGNCSPSNRIKMERQLRKKEEGGRYRRENMRTKGNKQQRNKRREGTGGRENQQREYEEGGNRRNLVIDSTGRGQSADGVREALA